VFLRELTHASFIGQIWPGASHLWLGKQPGRSHTRTPVSPLGTIVLAGSNADIRAVSMALAMSFITFLTSIWGEGIVFTWLLNLTGISALLVWGSIGLISLRFRVAYRAQGRSLSDLPYTQPLYPLLPIGVVVLAIMMFIAEGYSAVKEEPFQAKVCVLFKSSIFSHLIAPMTERRCDIHRCCPLRRAIHRLHTV
jgi:L-asparagine transporter-like permease